MNSHFFARYNFLSSFMAAYLPVYYKKLKIIIIY